MKHNFIAKVDTSGRIYLPRKVAKRYNSFQPGAEIAIEFDDEQKNMLIRELDEK